MDLTSRIRRGLPLDRVLALLTADDGGTLSDLRGVYAWLATLSPEHSERLVRRDPLGVVLYGDSTVLQSSTKLVALAALRDLARENPWFRAENWTARPFGGLASADVEPQLSAILQDASTHPVVLACVLDAVRFGQPLPNLADEALRLARDPQQRRFVRVAALKAYRHVSADPIEGLHQLLLDIHENRVEDDDRELRGVLLSSLYPQHVGSDEIARYLIEPPADLIGEYLLFVEHELPSRTTPNDVPRLLDALVLHSGLQSSRRRHTWRRLFSRMLLIGLRMHGEGVTADRLYEWLGLALDEHRGSAVDGRVADEIRGWLGERPSIVRALFQQWLADVEVHEIRLEGIYFWKRMQGADPPAGFGQWLLSLAAADPDDTRADFLFREAVQLRTGRHDRDDAPAIDELYAFVDIHSRFGAALRSEMCWQIPDWRRKMAERSREEDRRVRERRALRVDNLSQHLEAIRSGSAIGGLSFLAKLWFGLFADVDHTLSPEERLRVETDEKTTAAALSGFASALQNAKMPSPRSIGESHVRSRQYDFGYVVLAGMKLVADSSMENLLALPDATLESAAAFHLSNLTETPHSWMKDLATARSDIVARALAAFWEPHLRRGAEHIPGLYLISGDGPLEAASRRVTLQLLSAFPTCKPDALRTLLRSALRYSSPGDTLEVIRRALGLRAVRGPSRTLWLGAAFVLAPREFSAKLRQKLGRSKEATRQALALIAGSWPGETTCLDHVSARSVALLAEMGGRYFAPSELAQGWVDRDDDGAMGETVRAILHRLGQNASREAGLALASLADDPALSAWREVIAHNVSAQARNRREAEFRYPTVQAVIAALAGGSPCTIRDLRAVTSSYLREIADDLRHGSTDGYKALWTVDSYERPDRPQPEGYCRDRILERLRLRLLPIGGFAEPEGHYADDRRADIKVLSGSFTLPVEVKRHYNPELWTAPRDQLQKRYSRDPSSHGHGIYLVLWYGLDYGRIPTPPAGFERPTSPRELQLALAGSLSAEDRVMTEIIVFDVSPSG
jgi:hypothetical protein